MVDYVRLAAAGCRLLRTPTRVARMNLHVCIQMGRIRQIMQPWYATLCNLNDDSMNISGCEIDSGADDNSNRFRNPAPLEVGSFHMLRTEIYLQA